MGGCVEVGDCMLGYGLCGVDDLFVFTEYRGL